MRERECGVREKEFYLCMSNYENGVLNFNGEFLLSIFIFMEAC
jgi:hypothetical protein